VHQFTIMAMPDQTGYRSRLCLISEIIGRNLSRVAVPASCCLLMPFDVKSLAELTARGGILPRRR
jgi:hypothetical protein